MTIEELAKLQENFSEQKVYIKDGYYRLRELSAHEYELTFALPGECGTSDYHPRIKFVVENGKITPTSLMDVVATPVKLIEASADTEDELAEALEALKEKFFAVKNL